MSTHQRADRAEWERLIDSLRHDAPVRPDEGLGWLASGLQRPECVLTHASGNVYVSDRHGVVLKIHPNGGTRCIGGQQLTGSIPLLSNGIAMQRNGAFLAANLGEQGGV